MTNTNLQCNISVYFDTVLQLLKKYQWIFNYPNIDVLVEGIPEKFPSDWVSYFKQLGFTNLQDLVQCKTKDFCPESLEIFLKEIDELSSREQWNEPQIDYNFNNNCGLGIKKQHEIKCLAPIVAGICEEIGSRNVIDVGAGLGYLSFLLADKFNCSVLAIEGSAEKIELALKTQMKYHAASQKNVTFFHHFITEDSSHEMQNFIKNKFSNSDKIIICGLHACADLSIAILRIFLEIEVIKAIVIMPCCYHRLNLKKIEDRKEYFTNFPVSEELKLKFAEYDAANFLRRPFLRLACQQTLGSFMKMSDEEHQNHAKEFLLRGILQVAAEKVGCRVIRTKRRSGKASDDANNFRDNFENLKRSHKLVPKDTTNETMSIGDPEFDQVLSELWEKHKDNLLLMEVLTGLQALLQNVCENLLLKDRIQFLRENGVTCDIRMVTHDNVSPRCNALVAIKN